MRKITWRQKLHYQFDNTMSKGTAALIGWLGLITAVFILGISLVVFATGISRYGDEPGLSLGEIIWRSLMRTLDPGTMGGDQGRPSFLFAMLLVTLGGIFIVGTLIGVLTSGIEGKLDELRKGRSFVIENGHTLILGWSPQIFTIVSELAAANANQRRSCVAILADKDKVEMEDEIRAKVGATGRMRLVCRTGDPLDLTDLEMVNPHAARSIVILPPANGDPDTQVIKTILALTNNPLRNPEPYHIVTAIRDPKNLEIARMVGRGEAQILLAGEIISRIIAQTCRQSGLSVVYTELLGFGGDEIYFHSEPRLTGRTYGEALFAYEDSAVIGLFREEGGAVLNPPPETSIAPGDRLIVIAEDDDTIQLSGTAHPAIDHDAIAAPPSRIPGPERTLILGWNSRGTSVLLELDNYVAPGSETTVVADTPEAAAEIAKVKARLRRQNLSFREADTTDRADLDSLAVPSYHHVIVLNYSDRLEPQAADARTLITLLHLRDICARVSTGFSIVSEMLDLRNRELADVTRADDFIVSDQLISFLFAQISENRHLGAVFAELLDHEGAEIYLKPAEDYVTPGRAVDFYTVLEAARRRNESAIGYRLRALARDAGRSYGVVLNPNKSEKVSFAVGDKIIVVAGD